MKNIMKYLAIVAGLNIVAASCVYDPPKSKNTLLGDWKVTDLKTTDSSADMGLLVMALVGVFPDSMRFEQDSLKMILHSKDSITTEAMKYTRKQDSLWIFNADDKAEPVVIQKRGDTVLLAGNGYTYYLVR